MEFTLESVRDFILQNGGRVTNHELVTHFKSHLNDQNLKGVNREKFKDFVNTLATIKVHEKGGKVLVLKKKFRPEYETAQNDPTRAMSEPPDQKQTSRNLDDIDGGHISKVRSEGNISTSSLEPGVNSSMRESTSTLSVSSLASSTSLEGQVEDDPNVSVMSVKDKVQHLNKMTSETDLQQAVTQKKKDPRFSHNKDGDVDDDSHSSGSGYVTLEPEEKEWLVTCSSADYHPMAKVLSKNSSLARLRDFTNGYTALHWAAKHGKAEVIKLIAGHLKAAEFNRRTNGGYTPLHLAAMQGHEDIIQLLVQTYRVDANIRDYSGKKAKQYLKNSASSKAQQLLLSRRLGPTLASSHSEDSFTRSASFRKSNRARAISSLIQTTSSGMRKAMLRTSWAGSSEDVTNDRTLRTTPSPSVTPPGSTGTSPATIRRGQTFAGRDKELMPPPSAPIRRSKKIGTSHSKDSLVDDDVKSKKMEQRCVSEPNLLPTQPSKMTYI